MALKGISCGHAGCNHRSGNTVENYAHGSIHFTASVMGNPEYLAAVKEAQPAKDERLVGIEHVNSFHAAHHEKRTLKQMKDWKEGAPAK